MNPRGSGRGGEISNRGESFIVGTPLNQGSDRGLSTFTPVWKQEVTDEQGRRRFHGAFTGGFSAGYFNTVGSKEGWTPQSFRSSRTSRHQWKKEDGERMGAQPEDFMDEEDLADKEARGELAVREGYSLAFQGRDEEGEMEGAREKERSIRDLFIVQTGNLGRKMLISMGWRPGTMIGERGMKEGKEEGEEKKGFSMGLYTVGEEEDGEARTGILLPSSSDYQSSRMEDAEGGLNVRRDGHGLGYEARIQRLGEMDHEGMSREDRLQRLEGQGLGRRKKKSKARRVRPSTALSFYEEEEEEGEEGGEGQDFPIPSVASTKRKREPEVGKSMEKRPKEDVHYSLPGFIFSWTIMPDQDVKGSSGEQGPGSGALTEMDIAAPEWCRGEGKRERIDEVGSRGTEEPPLTAAAPGSKGQWMDPGMARRALMDGFMPFQATDPGKHDRYRAFLGWQAAFGSEGEGGLDETLARGRYMAMAREGEEGEFVSAARIYQPMSAGMATRFTTAAPTVAGEEDEVRPKPLVERLPRRVRLAREGQYGPGRTREVKPWKPERLLLKRFGIKRG
ncbi:MAG: hypothetical protein DHS80DRAFT_21394 [Piptocephalis tieghemiana]|nr:MAG: hypothetical protein DHS80DRAFT_21394 [Piptocephalis tieghemiana]